MISRKLIYSILISLTALVLILSGIIFFTHKKELRVIFLNVGQGDATLVSRGNQQVLIDGGKDGKLLLEKLGKYVPFWDRKIEVAIMTHPDQDHIGGFVDLLKTYQVQNIIKTNSESDSETYKKLEEEIGQNSIEKTEAKKGVKINFQDIAIIDVLYPFNSLPETADDASNDNSVVLKLIYGENTFLFTGDLPNTKESELINMGENLNARILKVAHHGSKYSTSDEFLDSIKPQDAIISVGKNSYGHPSEEVLNRLVKHKINVMRTDEMGDIEYLCKNQDNLCTVAK